MPKRFVNVDAPALGLRIDRRDREVVRTCPIMTLPPKALIELLRPPFYERGLISVAAMRVHHVIHTATLAGAICIATAVELHHQHQPARPRELAHHDLDGVAVAQFFGVVARREILKAWQI